MKVSPRLVLPVAVLIGLVLAPLAAASAQALKPVAVVSIASINENLGDLEFLARTAGMEDAGKSVNFFARALTAGIDKSRPMGLYVLPEGRDFHAVAFIPVSDLKVLLEVQKEYVGTPKDVGNGILEIGADRTAYLKEQAGWAFVAESQGPLTNLPPDPTALLGDLPKNYNVAARLLVPNVPEELRKMVVDQLKVGVDRGLGASATRGAQFDRKSVEQVLRTWLGNLERYVNETEEITVGLGIDGERRATFFDLRLVAKDGTSLAKQMALQLEAKTQFAGLIKPDASVTFQSAVRYSPEQLAELGANLKSGREMWSKQIDDSPALPAEKRDAAKRLAGQFFDIVEKTAAQGKGDVGGALVLLPKSISFVGGGFVADGPALQKVIQDALELAKDQPNVPKVQFNAGSLGGVTLHRLSVAIPDREPEARELLGEKLEIVIGIGPQSIIVAGGKDPDQLLRSVLEQSAAQPDKAAAPLEVVVSLLPILKFYKSVDNNPLVGGLIANLEQSGSDRITVVTRPGSRDTTTRLEIQEGLLKAIGEVGKALGAGLHAAPL